MSLSSALIDDGAAALSDPPREIWVSIRTDAPLDRLFGSGSIDDPYNGSTAERFDEIMSTKAEAAAIVHLGPGIFRTTGFRAGAGWSVRTGQRIIGSGMYSTTLLYTAGFPFEVNTKTEVVSHDGSTPMDDWEISDLTIDCNLQNQPLAAGQSYAPLSLLAIAVFGNRIRVRRVRVINFGSRTPSHVNGDYDASSKEGFPIRIGGRATYRNPWPGSSGMAEEFTSFNAVIENCIIEQPDTSPAREVTCLVLPGGINGSAQPTYKLPSSYGEYAGYGERLHLEPFASIVRNCYFNLEFVNGRHGTPVPIESISYSGTAPNVQATITTRFPHNVNAGWNDYVSVLGASDATLLAGRFKVTSPSSDTPNSRTLICTVGSQPAGTPPTHVFKSTPPTMRAALAPGTGPEIVVTTVENHYRIKDDWVSITGASNDNYNGIFKVKFCSIKHQAPTGQLPCRSVCVDGRA